MKQVKPYALLWELWEPNSKYVPVVAVIPRSKSALMTKDILSGFQDSNNVDEGSIEMRRANFRVEIEKSTSSIERDMKINKINDSQNRWMSLRTAWNVSTCTLQGFIIINAIVWIMFSLNHKLLWE